MLPKVYQEFPTCPIMICDLEEESNLNQEELMLKILDNKKYAYSELGLQ